MIVWVQHRNSALAYKIKRYFNHFIQLQAKYSCPLKAFFTSLFINVHNFKNLSSDTSIASVSNAIVA